MEGDAERGVAMRSDRQRCGAMAVDVRRWLGMRGDI
jgi:hypothetical protein